MLFSRYLGTEETKTALSFMIDLLLNEQSQPNVVTTIMSILERLLTLRNELPMEIDEEPLVPDLEIDNIRSVDQNILSQLNRK